MTTIKRFTPDYKMHAVRFEAFAREAEHGEYVQFDAHQQEVSALEAERDALAVENAALKAINDDRRMFIMNGVQLGYIKVPTMEVDPALETIRIAVSPQVPTPATDAALAAIQAQGVEKAAAALDALSAQSASATTQANFRAAAVYLRAEVLPAIGEAK